MTYLQAMILVGAILGVLAVSLYFSRNPYDNDDDIEPGWW